MAQFHVRHEGAVIGVAASPPKKDRVANGHFSMMNCGRHSPVNVVELRQVAVNVEVIRIALEHPRLEIAFRHKVKSGIFQNPKALGLKTSFEVRGCERCSEKSLC